MSFLPPPGGPIADRNSMSTIFNLEVSFLSYQWWWSIHCLSSSIGGWAPYISLAGMFRSSIQEKMTTDDQIIPNMWHAHFVPLSVSAFTNVDNTLLSHRRSKNTLPSSVKLGHNNILGLICWSSGWEVDTVGRILLFWQRHQEAFVNNRFAGTSGSDKQHGNFMCQVCTQEKQLTCCLHGWDDEVWYLGRTSRVSANTSIHSEICDIDILTLAPVGMVFSSSVIESVQTFHCPCPFLWK